MSGECDSKKSNGSVALLRSRRWELEEARRKEESRVKQLIKDAESWAQATRIREYVAAPENAGAGAGMSSAEVQRWVTWARAIARQLDPLEYDDDGESDGKTGLPNDLAQTRA